MFYINIYNIEYNFTKKKTPDLEFTLLFATSNSHYFVNCYYKADDYGFSKIVIHIVLNYR